MLHRKHAWYSCYLANMTISTNGLQQTEPTVQIMRLKQTADAHHCEIILILSEEKQHNGVYCIFHPLAD